LTHTRPFPEDFENIHRDAYLRLKLRGIHYQDGIQTINQSSLMNSTTNKPSSVPSEDVKMTGKEDVSLSTGIVNQIHQKIQLLQGFNFDVENVLNQLRYQVDTIQTQI
jgi:hypothetical protein